MIKNLDNLVSVCTRLEPVILVLTIAVGSRKSCAMLHSMVQRAGGVKAPTMM